MAEREYYRLEMVIGTQGTEKTKSELRAMDKFIEGTKKRAETLNRMRIRPVISLSDRVSSPVRRITSALRTVTSRSWTVSIRAKDMTTETIGRIKDSIFSLQGMAMAAVGVLGVQKLGEATVGAAMDFETQMISMQHWLKGNKQLAQEYVTWMDKFAALTPFEMTDIFPAGARAVGITGGDVKQAERLLKLAADMAALTPEKTIRDAMEALADAQMGEFERLKEFNMKVTQDLFKQWGGFGGLVSQAEKTFSGGAEQLSRSTRGMISTITDFIKTQFRSVGMGINEALGPRLQRITDWFNNNQDTVNRWRTNLVNWGRQAADSLFGKFESIFSHIRTRYLDNPEFQNMSFDAKIGFIFDDIMGAFNKWLDNGGSEKIRSVAGKITGTLVNWLRENAAPIGLEAGKIGVQIAASILDGFVSEMRKTLLGNMILDAMVGAAAGSVIPGVGNVAGGIAGGVVGAADFGKQWINQQLDKVFGDPMQQAQEWQREKQARQVTVNPPAPPPISQMTIQTWGGLQSFMHHASGGILTRPHLGLVAEEGPEAIIPLHPGRRSQALGLWQQVGAYIGAGSQVPAAAGIGGINVYVGSVNVHGAAMDSDEEALRIGHIFLAKVKQITENR